MPDAFLAASFAWLDALLALHIGRIRLQRGGADDDEFRGLYISEADVDTLLTPAAPPLDALTAQREAVERAQARRATATGGSALLRVQQLFGLSDMERDLLLVALAPELDLRYERLFAYAQDDVTRKRPTVDLALALLCPDDTARLAARAVFEVGAPLRRHMLIELFEDGQRHAPLLARFLKLNERIAAELLGQPTLDAQLFGCARTVEVRRRIDELVLANETMARLRALPLHNRPHAPQGRGVVVALIGSYGAGRRAIAGALCAELGLPLLEIDVAGLLAREASQELFAVLALREAQLRGAGLLLAGANELLHDDRMAAPRAALLEALAGHTLPVFLALETEWEPRGALRGASYASVALPQPSYGERERLWRARLNGSTPDDTTLETLASAFKLSPGQIRDAAAAAHNLAGSAQITPANLFGGARAQGTDGLGRLARHVVTPYGWDDIVLPADQLGVLREITATLKHRRTVYERWGFENKLSGGKGLVVLFAGPSGTGKTMAASIVANDLGLDLYALNLASTVSKYIGETEKNLELVFAAARQSNAVLFFDEADAIFGKRSEVKDAHDRYANLEVGYLLQQLESYDGVVVLATNLRKNMDDAFVRRLHYAIEFPFPEEIDRLQIWRGVFPAETPLHADLDLEFAARQFKLAGGNIRNIALAAAFLAADDGAAVGMLHLVRAARREYQKLGKLVTAADFGPYLALVRG